MQPEDFFPICFVFVLFCHDFVLNKSNQGKNDSSGNQKNVIQGQRPDRKKQTHTINDITKIIRTKKQKSMSNSDSTKNWEHRPGVPIG